MSWLCLNCRKSQQNTAVSLQGAWEQVIIEQSEKICTETNTAVDMKWLDTSAQGIGGEELYAKTG